MEGYSWQTQMTTLIERNRYAFENSLFCDVEFSVVDSKGDIVTLQAHKYVLAISSPVFEAMFYGELAETGPTIDLPDCTKEGLQELLRYAYSDNVNLSGNNVMHVLYLAEKYMMPFLVKKCEQYLEHHLQPEDTFNILPQVQKMQNKKLQELCWRVIDSESQRAVSSDFFLDISYNTLYKVLERESLRIEEVQLFKYVERWPRKRVQESGGDVEDGQAKRDVLGDDLVRLIRFPVMSPVEFAEFVLDSNVLRMEEVTEISKKHQKIETPTKIFKSVARKGTWKTQWSYTRFSDYDIDWCYDSEGYKPNCLDFQVNKPVSLAGVRLFGKHSSDYQVKMKIAISGNAENTSLFQTREYVTYSTESELIDDAYHGFSVLFDNPIPLESGVRYTIEADIKGPGSEYGLGGRNVTYCGDAKIIFYDPLKHTFRTTVESGQFPALLLKFD